MKVSVRIVSESNFSFWSCCRSRENVTNSMSVSHIQKSDWTFSLKVSNVMWCGAMTEWVKKIMRVKHQHLPTRSSEFRFILLKLGSDFLWSHLSGGSLSFLLRLLVISLYPDLLGLLLTVASPEHDRYMKLLMRLSILTFQSRWCFPSPAPSWVCSACASPVPWPSWPRSSSCAPPSAPQWAASRSCAGRCPASVSQNVSTGLHGL